ncbi:DNA-binding protein [Vibrio sp. HA2012]|uniref:KilA-N domain-containing protein n=1 Tax=Vibrio sp. HA2012 TaxID=1971595 RepID=UPI000C2B54C5|nr:KilA-N domain-containing protein [Vibrio sp. HA2012]PJC85290.1 DNA-binding protein [Vibrio sp. HA2012]
MTNLTILSNEVRTFDHLYSLNDLHKAAGNKNRHRPKYWLANTQTTELIEEISKGGISPLHVKHGGTNSGTWVCRELVYAYAMWISAKFHLQVIRAFDAMIAAPHPIQGVTLSENQAGFVKCSFNLMDKLQADYQQTQQQYQAMQQQLAMMRSFCDQMEANLNQFNDRLNSNFNVISHVHLYKKMAMDYEGARELKNFMERTH